MRLADGTSGFSWKKKRDVSVVVDSRALADDLDLPACLSLVHFGTSFFVAILTFLAFPEPARVVMV